MGGRQDEQKDRFLRLGFLVYEQTGLLWGLGSKSSYFTQTFSPHCLRAFLFSLLLCLLDWKASSLNRHGIVCFAFKEETMACHWKQAPGRIISSSFISFLYPSIGILLSKFGQDGD